MSLFFFFNDTATTEIYTLSLHDALPISCAVCSSASRLREAITTVAPSAARALAHARPSPVLAPVTSATLLVSPKSIAFPFFTIDRSTFNELRGREHVSFFSSPLLYGLLSVASTD